MSYEVIVNSVTGSEPVTTSEAKSWAYIDTSADDTVIGQLITSAREKLEDFLGRDIVAKNRTYYVEYSENGEIELPYPPIASVSSVTSGQDDEAVASDEYNIRGLSDKRIDLDTYPQRYVKVTYVTEGMTDQRVKDAIKMIVEALYNSKGYLDAETMISFKIPDSAKQVVYGLKKMYL